MTNDTFKSVQHVLTGLYMCLALWLHSADSRVLLSDTKGGVPSSPGDICQIDRASPPGISGSG